MESIRVNRHVIVIAILVSLLFHSAAILYVLMQKTSHHKLTFLDNIIKIEELNNIIKIEEKEEQPLKIAPVEKDEKKEWVEIKAAPCAQPEPVTQPELVTQNDSTPPHNNPLAHAPETKRPRTKKKSQPQEAPQQPSHQPTAMFAQAGNKKPQLTLAQLTQGFIKHVKNKGSSSIVQEGNRGLVSMFGKKIGLPDEEQLKYERYLEKLTVCLYSSFKTYYDRIPQVGQEVVVDISFTLRRDGTAQQISIAKSSGIVLFDKVMLFIFQDASTSFPPVPRYIKDDPFTEFCRISYAGLLQRLRH